MAEEKVVDIEELHSNIMSGKKRGFPISKMLRELNIPVGSYYRAIEEAGLKTWREEKNSSLVSSDHIKLPSVLPKWWGSDLHRVGEKRLKKMSKKTDKVRFHHATAKDMANLKQKAAEKAHKKPSHEDEDRPQYL